MDRQTQWLGFLVAAASLAASFSVTADAQDADADAPATAPPPPGETEDSSEAPTSSLPGAEDEARMHFRLATRYYRTGRFEEAAPEYERAYALAPLPELLYNAYLSYREAGLLDDAVRMLSAFLPTVSDPVQAAAARARLDSLQRLAARVSSREAPQEAQEPAPPALGPGESRPDPSDAQLATTPLESEPASPVVAPWIVAAIGGATGLAAAVTGALAMDHHATLDSSCSATCPPDLASLQDEGRALSLATDVLWIAGAVIGAAGLVWGLVETLGQPGEARATETGGVAWSR